MKNLILFCVVLLCMTGQSAYAVDAQTRAAIEKMFTLTAMDKVVDRLYHRMEIEMGHQISQMDVPPAKLPEMERHFKRLSNDMRGNFTWQKLKEPMIAAYSEVYTKSEIEQLIAFYRSPLGRKVLENTPQLTDLSLRMIQQQMQATLMPKMHQLQHDMTIEFAQLD